MEDVLKILTRGIKPAKRAGEAGTSAMQPSLPSEGIQSNPQFFHDHVPGANSKKRKRGREKDTPTGIQTGGRDSDDDDGQVDVDFFEPKTGARGDDDDGQRPGSAATAGWWRNSKRDGNENDDDEDDDDDDKKLAGPPNKKRKPKGLLDEDECKRLLKSHRLKFTVLSGHAAGADSTAEQKRDQKQEAGKRGMKAAADANPSKKKRPQLFPRPLVAFSDLESTYDVAPKLLANVARQRFTEPTEVQMGSLPLLLNPKTALKKAETKAREISVKGEGGLDFMGVAPTGSGKTITFLIPAINRVLEQLGQQQQHEQEQEQEQEQEKEKEHVLSAVVVAPTRELARQIVNEGRKLALGSEVRIATMRRGLRLAAQEAEGQRDREEEDTRDDDRERHEGASSSSGADSDAEGSGSSNSEGEVSNKPRGRGSGEMKSPAQIDILVTTPRVLLKSLSDEGENKGKDRNSAQNTTEAGNQTSRTAKLRTLPTVRSLILDEADALLDPMFRKQVLGIWRACTNPHLRLTCWSATMPADIEELIVKELSRRASCQPSDLRQHPLVRLVVGLKDTAVPNISHRLVYTANEAGKLYALRQLLHPASSSASAPSANHAASSAATTAPSSAGLPANLRPPFLIFTQTVERAQTLHEELRYDIPAAAGGHARVAVLHAALPDAARRRAVDRFRRGEAWVLITTDVLARGVDFAGVNGVVSYDIPGSAAAYVHRAGRTGRAGRAGGVAVTFYTMEDVPYVRAVANVIAASERQAGLGGAGEGGRGQGGGGGGGGGGPGGSAGGLPKWLLDALPKVGQADRKKLKTRGVESRRSGSRGSGGDKPGARRKGGAAQITTQSSWERRKANNRAGAIEASKRRKKAQMKEARAGVDMEEWGGIED